MSDISLNTTSPFLFRDKDDITIENLNRLIDWVVSNFKEIENELQLIDDRLALLE